MAEICCGVVGDTEASSTVSCEPSPRSARRRRLEIRRLRFGPGAGDAADSGRKRRRLDSTADDDSRPPAEVLGDDLTEERVQLVAEIGKRMRLDLVAGSDPEPPRLPPVESAPSDRWPRYGITSVCGRRREMEDAVSVLPDFLRRDCQLPGQHHFFAVFDGHGCSHVAVSCKNRMHEIVADELSSLRPGAAPPPPEEWKEAMHRSFARMDAAVAGGSRPGTPCRCAIPTAKCDHVGSTAVVAVVGPTHIVVANCGDSRAVLCRDGVAVPLSSDHKPDRPDELQRIEAAGGRVIYWDGARVLGVLAMSRAIGDNYLKPFVVSEPEVTVTGRAEGDECLILASDGLWDVVANETACEIVRTCLRGRAPAAEAPSAGAGDGERGPDKACSDAAMLLTKLALARHSGDNVSVVVVDLRKNP